MSIGENIKRKREERSLTQKELAEAVGVTQSMVAQIERGSKVPTMGLGKDIAIVLDCSMEELTA